jgi:type III pantothenate kinase
MDLLLDIGNTRLKWAMLADGALTGSGEAQHLDDQAGAISAMLRGCAESPHRVLAANVAGAELAGQITTAIQERWQLAVEYASTDATCGRITSGYEDPGQLGVDRWLAILAAANHYPTAVCVVDAGTALTIDFVAADGNHLGGLILPGLGLMWRALTSETGDLQRFAGAVEEAGLIEVLTPARDTAAAIRGGSLSALVGLIRSSTESLRERCGEATLVLTGGDAERLIPHLPNDLRHHPLLVLEGLVVRSADPDPANSSV